MLAINYLIFFVGSFHLSVLGFPDQLLAAGSINHLREALRLLSLSIESLSVCLATMFQIGKDPLVI
jgi:hypothetical protein